jgi:hypothetical protein
MIGIKVHNHTSFIVILYHRDIGIAVYPLYLRLKGDIGKNFTTIIMNYSKSLIHIGRIGKGNRRKRKNGGDGKNDRLEHCVSPLEVCEETFLVSLSMFYQTTEKMSRTFLYFFNFFSILDYKIYHIKIDKEQKNNPHPYRRYNPKPIPRNNFTQLKCDE